MNILDHREPMPRRTFLKAAGITLALPWLDAMNVCANSVTGPNRTFGIPAILVH